MYSIYLHYLLYFYLEDRGGLIDPTDDFSSRLWTVYKFVDKVLPSVSHCSNILQDFVEMLLPRLLECSELKCTSGRDQTTNTGQIIPHHKEILRHALKKFISPILKNYGKGISDVNEPPPITQNKPAKRKVLKLR